MALDPSKLAYAGAFVIFVGLMYRTAGTKITGALDAYSNGIRRQLDEARTLREDAQALLASYKRKQHDDQAEAQNVLERARQEAESLRAQALEDLASQMTRQEKNTLDRIALAEASALQTVRTQAVQAVLASVTLLLRERAAHTTTDALLQTLDQLPLATLESAPVQPGAVGKQRVSA
jgi:F-type H+-transporting ATPase subunit b